MEKTKTTTPEKLRDALDILSEAGYDVFYNGTQLIRSKKSWNWKHINYQAINQAEFLLQILRGQAVE